LQLGEVLLTGGNGYLGARIAKELQSRSVPVRMLHYSDVQANLSIPIDIGQAETLLLVGAAIPKNSVDLESISAAASNVAFMETLIRQEFKQLRRIIYISTIDVYDYQGKIDESTIPNPQNCNCKKPGNGHLVHNSTDGKCIWGVGRQNSESYQCFF
jgi:nucleoside-diphosphate-sugar epimerase